MIWLLLAAFCALLYSLWRLSCPRCGHLSVHGRGAALRCGWPECDYPAEPKTHYMLAGSLIIATRIKKHQDEYSAPVKKTRARQ